MGVKLIMFSNINRVAMEFEKKTHVANLEQGRDMVKNMISMSNEIEKLRPELANAEKRAKAAAAAANPRYAANYANPGMGYGGVSYLVQYDMHQIAKYLLHTAACSIGFLTQCADSCALCFRDLVV
ncbi:hypothetical protein Nepgr_014181 [Nepenthes gracilis]|uniref:Uncharacterized protein n=1 Tax=Nepenthes gracilis TaxID=150966 RepID=A0AAD3SK78_NEPGR|nr:hypothetical protein Nepgr_014181 [Nepenthes gracilis]